jgi:hypothetical protein
VETLRHHADLQAQSTKVFPGTTTTNITNDPAAPEVSTTGDHRRIFTPHGAPTGRRSADLAHVLTGQQSVDLESNTRLPTPDRPPINTISLTATRSVASRDAYRDSFSGLLTGGVRD